MYKEGFSVYAELMKAVARGDKDTASFIAKSGAFNQRPAKQSFNYHNELFSQPTHQYYYSKDFEKDRNLRDCFFVKYLVVKECEVKRGNNINRCTWERGIYTYHKEQVEVYRYREYMMNDFKMEEYLTTDKKVLNHIYQYIKDARFDLTNKYPVNELFYTQDMGYDVLITKVFLELVNRCIDRDTFGTSKMSGSHLNVEDYLIGKYDDILSTDTKWWDAQTRRLNKYYDFDSDAVEDIRYYTNKQDFLSNYTLKTSGSIERVAYDIQNVINYLIEKGLVRKWVQDVVKDKMWRTWYGITPQGWKVL